MTFQFKKQTTDQFGNTHYHLADDARKYKITKKENGEFCYDAHASNLDGSRPRIIRGDTKAGEKKITQLKKFVESI
jgi:hypothetical protein